MFHLSKMSKFIKSSSQIRSPKTYLYQYNDTNFKLVYLNSVKERGWEEEKKSTQLSFIAKTDSEEIQRISLCRTRTNIKEIALCNNFEFFATLTINSKNADRFSLQECQDLLKKKLKKLKRKNSNFAYIFITEKHKNGAFHFHGLIKGVDDFYINSNGYLSHSIFDEIGYNSFSKINDYTKTCNYILKYITKDCIKNENNQIYICSRGLKRATKFEITSNIEIQWKYENEFCKIFDFRLDELDKNFLIDLMNSIK